MSDIRYSRNPRHYPGQDFNNLVIAIFALGALLGLVTGGCSIIPPLPDPDPIEPGTTTTTTTTSTTHPPVSADLPAFLFGGCSAGEWTQLDPEQFADAMNAAGCNSHVVEGLAAAYDTSEDGYNDLKLDIVVARLALWIKVMQEHRIWTVIHYCNGNDETFSRWGAAAHRAAIQQLQAAVGTAYIVLVPVAELADESGDTEFCAWAINWWGSKGGICGWNGKGRPQSVPTCVRVCDYHLQALDDIGPAIPGVVTLLDTDNGPAINALRAPYWSPAKLQAWMPYYRQHNRSINVYGFHQDGIDTDALRIIGEAYGARTVPVRRAVCIGLLNTAGGDAACPGTDVDSRTVYGWAGGFDTRTRLMDKAATVEGVKGIIRDANAGMVPGDLLLVSISGHGTTRPDASGDEANGKDEGVVLWDRVWWDDEIWDFICTLNPCRVILVSDTCHSQGNWRTLGRVLTLGLLPRQYVQLELPLDDARRGEWEGEIIQLAGCREENYSYGADDGGTWTQTLDRQRPLATSWMDLYERAAAAMPGNQVPAWSTYNASPSFMEDWPL